MELTINRSSDEAGRDSLVLDGSIDLVTRQALLDEGHAILDRGDGLVLDMAEVDFIDSTGIGALVELARAAKAQGSSVLISRSSARVARVLEFSGLDQALDALSPVSDAGPGTR
jgi:anti-anti-sigma factor